MSSHILESAQKPQLRKAFTLLKTHACKVANFTLQWQDLEDHLRFIHSQIESKIQLQQNTVKNKQNDTSPPNKQLISTQNSGNQETEINDKDKTESKTSYLPARNGKELILYIKEHRKDVGKRLYGLFKAVDDPGKLVLEALQEFYPPGFTKGEVVDSEIRRNCVVLLEEFGRVRKRVEPHVREEAKRLAVEWKGRVENSLEALGFLQLLIGFDLVGEFDSDEILKHFDNVVMRREAPELLRALGFADKASEIIQKLIQKYRRLEAIRFIYEFDLVKQFSLVSLLRAHAKHAKKVAKEIRKKGNNSPKARDDATNSEIAALRGMIRFIKNYELSSQYSPKILRNHIQQLERQRKESKEDTKATVSETQSQQLKGNKRTSTAPKAQQNRNKRPCTIAADATANTSQAIHSKELSHCQPANLFAGQGAQPLIRSADIDAPSKAVTYSYGSAASNIQSIHPSPNQPLNLFTSAQHLAPSLRKYHSADLDGQASAGIDALSKAASYPSLAPGPYGLAGSASVHPHMSSSPRTYERTVLANGSSGQFGLARTHTPMNFASNVNTNVSAPYYHGDLLGSSVFYNRQASSSRTGMAPNTSSNTSGYYDIPTNFASNANTNVSAPYYHGDRLGSSLYYNRQASSSRTGMAPNTSSNTSGYYNMPLSTTGNLGLSSKYPPPVYHP